MRESALVRAIMAEVRRRCPHAWCAKLSDRHTRGLPDILIVTRGDDRCLWVLWVECKTATGRIAPIQKAAAAQFEATDIACVAIVARSVADVMEKLESWGCCDG